MADPSPLPWRKVFSEMGGYDCITDAFVVLSADKKHAAVLDCGRVANPSIEANADLIVRSVNAHAALVEALRAVLFDTVSSDISDLPADSDGRFLNAAVIRRVAAALALAEAKWRDDPDGDDDPLLSHRRLIALADALARAETQP